ncbi:hypothetical protein [Solimicrobium silvestre]|uniref:Uncharacterized protein n=1 Tax=Solimicrobium silvestre TaxID=2099400 RepID=A0A2S9H335_9BURK|nr:hypothetical protein [Solimicrobium silvestre]PRC94395.1 hypothetical protein S2091_1016 [Solimicrobium silvestre]
MTFEALAYFHDFNVSDFPQEWLPLTYLYDPDLPLFPILYFHELDPTLDATQRPGERDRIFGFVHSIAYDRSLGVLRVTLASSKDLSLHVNSRFVDIAKMAARSRLGLDNPVVLNDITGALTNSLVAANALLRELWIQIVASSFGGKLPFGKCWDAIFGLARYIASWNSEGGRKGELIQLHAYVAAFGERIQTGGGIHADFYLLPTWSEFRDNSNPLALFSKYSSLVGPSGATVFFSNAFTNIVNLGSSSYSRFELNNVRISTGNNFRNLNTDALVALIEQAPRGRVRTALYDNYSAFNRGPGRAILSLLMHHDLRTGKWNPEKLTQQDCISQYTGLSSSYQSPKVMQLYAQQCFGSLPALPIDNWVKTFLSAPIGLSVAPRNFHATIFASSTVWGKVERLIWMAAQARKVHSSVAENILWCVRYGGPAKEMRSANPLSCKVCDTHIRAACPSYASIQNMNITFNLVSAPPNGFNVRTSSGDNLNQNQTFTASEGLNAYDEYTTKDRPSQFAAYPSPNHAGGAAMTVSNFINTY